MNDHVGLGLVTSISTACGYTGVNVVFTSGYSETWHPSQFFGVFLLIASGRGSPA